MKKISVMAVLFAFAVCFTAPQASADDGFIGWDGLIATNNPVELSDVGVDYLAQHADQDVNGSGFKGWAYIGAMNTGNANWTGMSISLYNATVGGTTYVATSVKIIDSPSQYQPSVMAPNSVASWVIGTNATGHATMDIMFSSAVAPNGTVFVQLWTDNTANQVPYFGVAFHAIPEPATGSLVALTGVVALFIRKTRKHYSLR